MRGVDLLDDYRVNCEHEWVGNSLRGEVRHHVVFVEADDPGMEKSLQRQDRDKYMELTQIHESIETMVVITKLRKSETRRVQIGERTEEMCDVLLKLRKLMNGVKKVTMHQVRGMNVDGLRKLLEAVFRDVEIDIELFTTKSTARVEKGRETCAIVVEEEGMQYRDILAKVRPILKERRPKRYKGNENYQRGKAIDNL